MTAANKSTSGNDLFRGADAGSLKSSDYIDAGTGTDSITATVAEGAAQEIAPMLISVENVTLNLTTENTTNGAITFNGVDSTGLDTITLKSDGVEAVTANVKGIATSDVVTVSGGTTGKVVTSTITYDKVTGKTDAATVGLKDFANVTAAGIETVTANLTAYTGTLTVADATTVTLNAGSDAKKTSSVTDVAQAQAALATLNLGGSGEALTVGTAIDFKGDATLNITNTGKTTVSVANLAAASNTLTATGGAGKDFINIASVAQGTITVNTNAGNDQVTIDGGVVTVNTGEGDDTLVVTTVASVTSADKINLGAGTNTVSVGSQALGANEKALLALITGATKLESTYTLNTAAADVTSKSVDADAVSTVSTFVLTGDVIFDEIPVTTGAGATALSLTNVENDDKFIIDGDLRGQTGKTTGAGGNAIAAGVLLDNGANVLNLELIGGKTSTDGVDAVGGTKAGATADGQALAASAFETVNINLVDNNEDEDAATVALHDWSSTGGVTIGTNAKIVITGSGDIKLGTVAGTNATVDASALKGALTVTTADGSNTTIKGGSGKNTLTGGSGVDTIIGGANDDVIDGKAGADVMTGGAGKDTFKVASTGATTAITDTVNDFLIGASGDTLDLTSTTIVANKASTDVSAAIGGAGAVAGDTLTASVAKGIVTLSGNATAKIDTVAELVDIFKLIDVDTTAGTAAIVMGGSTYVISDTAADAVIEVVKLTGVTSATSVAATAAEGAILIA